MKILSRALLVFSILLMAMPDAASAVPASPELHEKQQPGGSRFKARLWGDEWMNGWETEDGDTIVREEGSGKWTYATHARDGGLVSSGRRVGIDARPDGHQKHLRPTGESLSRSLSRRPGSRHTISGPALSGAEGGPAGVGEGGPAGGPLLPPVTSALTGTANIAVVLMSFGTPAYTPSDFNTLLFGSGNYSMKDFHEQASYGAFSVSPGPGGIAGWYPAAAPGYFYGFQYGPDAAAQLVKEAAVAADAGGFDFAPYDQNGDCYVDTMMVVHMGAGREETGDDTQIWSHFWTLEDAGKGEYVTNDVCPADPLQFVKVNNYIIVPERSVSGGQSTVGVHSHEYGHAIGLPDLYDTILLMPSSGIGAWGIMASGSYNKVTVAGDRPALHDPWSRFYLGWITPLPISGAMTDEEIVAASHAADVYLYSGGTITHPAMGEYFLIENRYKDGFDAGLPSSGVLAWRISGSAITTGLADNSVNAYECVPIAPDYCMGRTYGVQLIQADNQWHLESGANQGDAFDAFFAGTGGTTSLTGATAPDSRFFNGTPSDFNMTGVGTAGVTMTATFTIADTTPPSGSIQINNGGLCAPGTQAELTLSAGDPSGVAEMCISNTTSCSAWEPFAATRSWNLTAGNGLKSVYVRFKDGLGNANATSYSDTITLYAAVPDTTISSSPPNPSTVTTASFNFTRTEGHYFECRIDGGSFFDCSPPKSYSSLTEGEHTFEVRGVTCAGTADPTPAAYMWKVDLTAPDTTITFAPFAMASSQTATFLFSSPDSDVTGYACSLDGGAFTSCASPAVYAGLAESLHHFEVRATDAAGYIDQSPAVHNWTVDVSAPETAIESGPTGWWTSQSASFTFSSSDGTAVFECSLDSGAFTGCSSPAVFSGLNETGHTFAVRAKDPAGNLDATPASRSFTVDVTAPETSIESGPSGWWTSQSASFSFNSPDGTAIFECSLDSGAFTGCTSPAVYSSLSETGHTFLVRAKDPAGHADPTPASRSFTVDVTAPETVIESGPSGWWTSQTASFSFSSPDGTAAFECSLDSGAFSGCTSPAVYSSLGETGHTFAVRAKDPAGTTDATPASRSFAVDVTAPETVIESGPSGWWTSQSASFGFSSADGSAVFECSMDGGAFSGCTSPAIYTSITETGHTFAVRAKDPAGFLDQSPASRSFSVDVTPPVTAILSHPADPVNQTSAAFTFNAESGASFECRVDAASFAPCASPALYSGLGAGDHAFQVRATDPAGNPEAAAAGYNWTIDLTAPATTITSAPAALVTMITASFTFSANEPSTSVCSIDGGAFTACTSPAAYAGLVDGEHHFQVQATDLAGNFEAPVHHYWQIDSRSPQTTLLSRPDAVTRNVNAMLDFTADEIGVSYRCRFDGVPIDPCFRPQNFFNLNDGVHTFEVWSMDPAGNTEQPAVSWAWTVDTRNPVASITAAPPAVTTSPTVSFGFIADEPGVAFECSRDGQPMTSCSSPVTYAGLADGSYSFSVRATDQAGNASNTLSRSWRVDTVAPETSITSGPTGTVQATSADLWFYASETSTFECRLDGAPFTACVNPLLLSDLAPGSHIFEVRAIDQAGLVDATPDVRAWTVAPDTTPPDTWLTGVPPLLTAEASAEFSFFSPDTDVAGFECRLDNGPIEPCPLPQRYVGLSDGSHTFVVMARDMAGNVDPTPAVHIWTIDLTAPETTLQSAPSATTTETTAVFAFSANETASFECRIDAYPFGPCTSPAVYPGLSTGSHTFDVRALDQVGNTDPTPASHGWNVLVLAPNPPVVSGPTSTTNATPTWTWLSGGGGAGWFRHQLDGEGGMWTETGATSFTPAGPLAPGPHALYVQERNGSGVWSASGSFTITVEQGASCGWFPYEGINYACVGSTAELQACLTAAQTDGSPNSILVKEGAYQGNFAYAGSEPFGVLLQGGYSADCMTRVADPSSTVLDGDVNSDGNGDGVTLRMRNENESLPAGITVDGFTIINGTEPADAGGCLSISTGAGTAKVNGNIVHGCTAAYGGGIFADASGGQVVVTNNIVYGNTAAQIGGGIVVATTTGHVSALNNTIMDNTVVSVDGSGGGFAGAIMGNTGSVDVANNIIWNNLAPAGSGSDLAMYDDFEKTAEGPPGDGIHALFSIVNNAVTSSLAVMTTAPAGFILDPGNKIGIDPLFVNAAGGNYRLQSASPLIDQGMNGHPDLPATDLDGNIRIRGAAVDMGAYESAYVLPVTGVTLAAGPLSPQFIGTPVIFTSVASGGSGTYQYKFLYKLSTSPTWSVAQAYSSSNTWTWSTGGMAAGSYQIQVWARNAGSTAVYEAVKTVGYTLKSTAATGATLSASPTSPRPIGTLVTFTALGSGGTGSYEYKFIYKLSTAPTWSTGRAYSATNTWAWTTGSLPAGSYTIQVWVRSIGSTANYEVVKTIGYTLKAPAATGVTIMPDQVSPGIVGADITFTAFGSGGSGAYQYQFLYKKSTDPTWTSGQVYSPSASWLWETGSLSAGSYLIQVRVRNAGSTAAYEVLKTVGYTLQ